MPHIVETLAISQHSTSDVNLLPIKIPVEGFIAITQLDGTVHHCGSAFNHLIRLEWPEWPGMQLPNALLSAFHRSKPSRFFGRRVTASVEKLGELLLVRAAQIDLLGRLSPREYEVAQMYGKGKTHKEIARTMDVAPTTIRNFLQRIYQKLQIRDKAELAALVIHREENLADLLAKQNAVPDINRQTRKIQ